MNGMRYITVTGERRRTSVWVRFSGVLRLLRCTGDCGDRRRTSLGDRRFGELGGDLRFRERLRLRLPRLRLTCRFSGQQKCAFNTARSRLMADDSALRPLARLPYCIDMTRDRFLSCCRLLCTSS